MLKSKFKIFNGKGQIGETTSWVIATLIIIGILIIFIYISILMADVKKISISNIQSSEQEIDLLSEKTSFAYKLTDNKDKMLIDNLLKEENNE